MMIRKQSTNLYYIKTETKHHICCIKTVLKHRARQVNPVQKYQTLTRITENHIRNIHLATGTHFQPKHARLNQPDQPCPSEGVNICLNVALSKDYTLAGTMCCSIVSQHDHLLVVKET